MLVSTSCTLPAESLGSKRLCQQGIAVATLTRHFERHLCSLLNSPETIFVNSSIFQRLNCASFGDLVRPGVSFSLGLNRLMLRFESRILLFMLQFFVAAVTIAQWTMIPFYLSFVLSIKSRLKLPKKSHFSRSLNSLSGMKALRANSTLRVGFLNEISFLVGQFKKISALLVYSICFHETVHDKCGRLDKSAGQNENVLERGFVRLCLKSVNIK